MKRQFITKKYVVSIIVLLALLVIALWLSPSDKLFNTPDTQSDTQPQYPSSYLTHTKTTQYNQQGEITHILTADKVQNFEENIPSTNNYALLEQPYFTLFNQSETNTAPWIIKSQQGRSNNNHETFILNNDVYIQHQSNSTDNPSMTIITSEQLTIIPKQQYAETDKPVTIKTESGVTTSTGLKISLDANTIELLSNVRSRYEPR